MLIRAGSSPVTRTISSVHNESDEHSILFCLYLIVWSRFSALFLLYRYRLVLEPTFHLKSSQITAVIFSALGSAKLNSKLLGKQWRGAQLLGGTYALGSSLAHKNYLVGKVKAKR